MVWSNYGRDHGVRYWSYTSPINIRRLVGEAYKITYSRPRNMTHRAANPVPKFVLSKLFSWPILRAAKQLEEFVLISDASEKVDEMNKVATEITNTTIQHITDLSQITLETTNHTMQQINDTINRITDNVVTQTNDTLDEINEWFKEK